MSKKFLTFFLLILAGQFLRAEELGQPADDNENVVSQNLLENYRRSSLCIILVTHQGTKYAEQMEEQFMKMKLPERYNDHNIQLRVLHTDKSVGAKQIASMMKNNNVAKQLVSKWFNRNSQNGRMDMNLIHARGGYNATVADADMADLTELGRRNTLLDAGTELIQNTFVLVCDMKYRSKDGVGIGLAFAGALLTAGMQYAGTVSNTNVDEAVQSMAEATVAMADMGGFSVKMDAHLLKLDWSENRLNEIYQNYWVNEDTPADEAEARKKRYESRSLNYDLEYLGHYKSSATTLAMKSESDLDAVLREVTERTIDRSIKELSLQFPIFRPRTPLVTQNGEYYAYVGTKEDVNDRTKFDVLEVVKSKGKTEYKTVGIMKVQPGRVWDNKNIEMTDYQIGTNDGTYLKRASGRRDLSSSYQLRENKDIMVMGKKKWNFMMGLYAGYAELPSETKTHYSYSYKIGGKKYYNSYTTSETESGVSAGWEMSELWNFSKHFSWSVLGMRLGARSGFEINGFTGLMYHTNNIGRSKNCFFVWPIVGYSYVANRHSSPSFLDYGVRVGFNFKQLIYVAGEYGANNRIGINIGFELF